MKSENSKKVSNYKYFNPNPTAKFKKNGEPFKWNKCDCVIRAFSGATKLSWLESYNTLADIAREMFDVPNSKEVLEKALTQRGFETVSCQPKKGERRPTVSELAKTTTDYICVFNVANHNVYAEDGIYFDTWDCGEYSVYTYWRIKK